MRGIIFPQVTGLIIRALTDAFSTHPVFRDALVCRELPVAADRGPVMVTVRGDSAIDDGPVSEHRFGVNVWAPTYPSADELSRYAMAILRNLPDGRPIVLTDAFSGPTVGSDEHMIVDESDLVRMFFTFRVWLRPQPFPTI